VSNERTPDVSEPDVELTHNRTTVVSVPTCEWHTTCTLIVATIDKPRGLPVCTMATLSSVANFRPHSWRLFQMSNNTTVETLSGTPLQLKARELNRVSIS
jgi:hypothetical protein